MDRGFGPRNRKNNVLCCVPKSCFLGGEKGKKKCCKRSEKESKLITKNQSSEGSYSYIDVKKAF